MVTTAMARGELQSWRRDRCPARRAGLPGASSFRRDSLEIRGARRGAGWAVINVRRDGKGCRVSEN